MKSVFPCLLLVASACFGRECTIYISNEICLDYTWGLTDQQTREATAELIRAHLDLMSTTDNEPWEHQNRYTCTVTNEVLFFLEKYPERTQELIQRIREGRLMLSPFLCNTNWGFPGVEGFLRSLQPAKRLAVRWNLSLEHAVHSELPSYPWGAVPLLSGSGIRWCAKPYYDFDACFEALENPAVFEYVGPDGSRLRAVLDSWACRHFTYAQGAGILKRVWHKDNPTTVEDFWLGHYQTLANYPLDIVLAQGTHGDIALDSWKEAGYVHDGIKRFNQSPGRPARLAHATFEMFADAVDIAQEKAPFLKTVRGEFGHTWELWPVSLAKYAAQTREGERQLLAAEALLASGGMSLENDKLRTRHRAAEWHLAMLLDHAWNGAGPKNKKHNAHLRKRFAGILLNECAHLQKAGWQGLGVQPDSSHIILYNPTSVPRHMPVRLPRQERTSCRIRGQSGLLACQVDADDLVFVSEQIPGYGFAEYDIETISAPQPPVPDGVTIQSPFYRITAPAERNWHHMLHSRAGEPLFSGDEPDFLKLLYRSQSDQSVEFTSARVTADGPVVSALEMQGRLPHTAVTIMFRLYQALDRIDVTVRLHKQPVDQEEAVLLQFGEAVSTLQVETCGAVVKPYPRPQGDLLPGADPHRMVVQGFVTGQMSKNRHLIVSPLDAFCLRPDVAPLAFELLGNDQNYREVTHDQNGETDFTFRFVLQVKQSPYNNAQAFAFSRQAATPVLATLGRVSSDLPQPLVGINPEQAVATTLKPADPAFGQGVILRLWETSTTDDMIVVQTRSRLILCDLLEQDRRSLVPKDMGTEIPVRPRGFTSIRLRD